MLRKEIYCSFTISSISISNCERLIIYINHTTPYISGCQTIYFIGALIWCVEQIYNKDSAYILTLNDDYIHTNPQF